jgi:hypothetical protein
MQCIRRRCRACLFSRDTRRSYARADFASADHRVIIDYFSNNLVVAEQSCCRDLKKYP